MLTYNIHQPIETVRDNIQSQIEDWSFRLGWPFSGKHRLFHGDVWDNGFCLKLIIDYQNSFLPVAYGRLKCHLDGTSVEVRFRPNLFGGLFILSWTTGWSWRLVTSFTNSSTPRLFDVGISAGMIVFLWVVMLTAMGIGIDQYQRAFKQVFSRLDHGRDERSMG